MVIRSCSIKNLLFRQYENYCHTLIDIQNILQGYKVQNRIAPKNDLYLLQKSIFICIQIWQEASRRRKWCKYWRWNILNEAILDFPPKRMFKALNFLIQFPQHFHFCIYKTYISKNKLVFWFKINFPFDLFTYEECQ